MDSIDLETVPDRVWPNGGGGDGGIVEAALEGNLQFKCQFLTSIHHWQSYEVTLSNKGKAGGNAMDFTRNPEREWNAKRSIEDETTTKTTPNWL